MSKRRAVAFLGQRLIALREFGDLPLAHFDIGFDVRKPVLNPRDRVAELRIVDQRLGVGVVENVAHLVRLVAVVDVHMDEAAEEGRAHAFGVFGAVAQIERDLVARPGPARGQRTRQIVHARPGLAPRDHPLAMDEGRSVGPDRARRGIEDVAVIPRHLPSLSMF